MQTQIEIGQVIHYIIVGVAGMGGLALLRSFLIRSVETMIKAKNEQDEAYKKQVDCAIMKIRGDIKDLYDRTDRIPVLEDRSLSVRSEIDELKREIREKR